LANIIAPFGSPGGRWGRHPPQGSLLFADKIILARKGRNTRSQIGMLLKFHSLSQRKSLPRLKGPGRQTTLNYTLTT
jgi:hypothetical protein